MDVRPTEPRPPESASQNKEEKKTDQKCTSHFDLGQYSADVILGDGQMAVASILLKKPPTGDNQKEEDTKRPLLWQYDQEEAKKREIWLKRLPENVDHSHEISALSELNPCKRDGYIYFQDKPEANDPSGEGHRYFVFQRAKCPSVSKVVKHFWPEFASWEVATKIIASTDFKLGRHAKYKPLSREQLLLEWQEIAPAVLHPQCEKDAALQKHFTSFFRDEEEMVEVIIMHRQDQDKHLLFSHFLGPSICFFLHVHHLVRLWEETGHEASSLGTILHSQIELFLNDKTIPRDPTTEFMQFLSFYTNEMPKRKLKPYRTEWRIFDDPAQKEWNGLCIPGTVDAVFQGIEDDSHFEIWDWKRSKEIKKFNNWGKGWQWGCMRGIDNCNFYHYTMQLNIYKYILEKHYGIKIASLWLGVFHPNLGEGNYDPISIPVMTKETHEMIQEWYTHLASTTKKPCQE